MIEVGSNHWPKTRGARDAIVQADSLAARLSVWNPTAGSDRCRNAFCRMALRPEFPSEQKILRYCAFWLAGIGILTLWNAWDEWRHASRASVE